jgi:S1/P1 Nuclease
MARLFRSRFVRAAVWSWPLLLLGARSARAWGDEGHRAIGELAYRHLSPRAREAVKEALTEPGYQSLADAATWPDTFARHHAEYKAMDAFHYVNVASRATSYRSDRDCPHGCIVSALSQFIGLLDSSWQLSLSERRYAIYWTAHLMGDLHQPLHVAHPDEKGGNATYVTFFDLPEQRKAHWVWDVGLLERRPQPWAPASPTASPAEALRALVDGLDAGLSDAQTRAFQRTTSPDAIVNEVLGISRRFAYLPAAGRIDATYEASRWPIVALQLEKAGVRLAAVLNRAFATTTATPTK